MLKHCFIPLIAANSICVAGAMLPSTDSAESLPVKSSPLPRYENNVFIETSFLYWVAKQEGNDYATQGAALTVPGTTDLNTSSVPGPITGSGKVYSPNSRIKPGFKVGLGINLKHGGWDLFSEYTYLFSKANSSVASNNLNTGILPIFSYAPNNSVLASTTYALSSGATGFVSGAAAQWSLQFKNINLELGRNMELFSGLSMRPHFGLQASWQNQTFNTDYAVSSITDFSQSLGNNQVLFNQDFWGLGLRFGFEGVWKCCNHLGLYANASAAALWGQFKCRAKSYDTNIGYSDVLISDQINSLHTVSPVLQLEAGVQSNWSLYDKYQFVAKAGWEEQVWFFQNQHSSSIADTSLVLQGLTVKLQFDF